MLSSRTPEPREQHRGGRVAGQLAADAGPDAGPRARVGDGRDQAQHRAGAGRRAARRGRGCRARRPSCTAPGRSCRSRRSRPRRRAAPPRRAAAGTSTMIPTSSSASPRTSSRIARAARSSATRADHREHDAQRPLALRRRAGDRAQLGAQELGPGEAEAQAALAQERVLLGRLGHRGQRLVGADVRASGRSAGGRRGRARSARRSRPARPRRAAPGGRGRGTRCAAGRRPRRPGRSRWRPRRRTRCWRRPRSACRRASPCPRAARPRARSRRAASSLAVALEGGDGVVAGVHARPCPRRRRARAACRRRAASTRRAEAEHGGDAQGAREDRRVRGRAAAGGGDAEHLVAVQRRGLAGGEVVGDEDAAGTGRPAASRRRDGAAPAGRRRGRRRRARAAAGRRARRARRRRSWRRRGRRRPRRCPLAIASRAGSRIAVVAEDQQVGVEDRRLGLARVGGGALAGLPRGRARVASSAASRSPSVGLDGGGRRGGAPGRWRCPGTPRCRAAPCRARARSRALRPAGTVRARRRPRRRRRSHRRRARARASSAASASGPLALTSSSWPWRAPRVASAVRLVAATGPAPVVALATVISRVVRAGQRDDLRHGPRVQAEAVAHRQPLAHPRRAPGAAAPRPPSASCRGATPSRPGPRAPRPRRRRGPRPCAPWRPRRPRPPPAARPRAATRSSDSSISTAISALMSALPRSMSTSTPSPPAASSIAVHHARRVGADAAVVHPARGDDRDVLAAHLAGELDHALRQPGAVRDDDDADHQRALRRARTRGAAPRPGARCGRPSCPRCASGRSRSRRPPGRARRRRSARTAGAPTSTAIWRFSTFSPYVPGDAAADRVVLDHAQARDEVEQVERRLADAVALLLAGRVVGDGHRHVAEVGAQLALSCRSRSSSQMS